MTDRDRLIELVDKAKEEYANDITDHTETDYIVECLLNNGVIVPPFKSGTKVYVINSKTSNNKNFYIFEDIITHYHFDEQGGVMCFENHIGVANWNWDKVFLTKEEAEEKLKECE